MESGLGQGSGKPEKERLYLPASGLCPRGTQDYRQQMGLQGQGGQLTQGARCCLGWGQSLGIDCGSTFAPVCRLQSIRMVLAIAAEYDLEG